MIGLGFLLICLKMESDSLSVHRRDRMPEDIFKCMSGMARNGSWILKISVLLVKPLDRMLLLSTRICLRLAARALKMDQVELLCINNQPIWHAR